MSDVKKCSKCGKLKPYSAFSPSKVTKSGRASGCKECAAEAYRRKYAADEKLRDDRRQYQRQWLKDPENYKAKLEWGHKKTEKIRTGLIPKKAKPTKEQRKIWRDTYRAKYPEKTRARSKFRIAVLNGTIKQQPCEICGNQSSEAHHPDYSRPYDVQWLCRIHHRMMERKLVEQRLVIVPSETNDLEVKD